MKWKLLTLFLFGMCMKNVAATDKQKQGGGRLKKLVGVSFLLLNGVLTDKTTSTNAIVCPTTLPPYSLDMMNYIRCGEKEATADFFENYLTARHEGDEVVKEPCLTIGAVYQKAKNLGKCASEKFTNIVSGAQQKILGKTLNRKKELEMFEEYLVNVDEVDDKVEELARDFEKLKNPNFFRIKTTADFLKKYTNIKTAEALEKALTPKYQLLDFEKVDRMMTYAKKMKTFDGSLYEYEYISDSDAIKEAANPKYQKLDFDKVDRMMLYAKKMKIYEYQAVEEALKPKYQTIDFDKVDRMIPYAKKMQNNYSLCNRKSCEFEAIEEALKPEYQTVDFDKADYILKNTSNSFDTTTDALSEEYQKYDVSRVRKVLEGLELLIPNDPKSAARLSLVISTLPFDNEKVDKIFDDCKTSKNKESCWKLKAKNMKKSDL